MRAVIQRVKKSSVSVNNGIVGKIGKGLPVLMGNAGDDRELPSCFQFCLLISWATPFETSGVANAEQTKHSCHFFKRIMS